MPSREKPAAPGPQDVDFDFDRPFRQPDAAGTAETRGGAAVLPMALAEMNFAVAPGILQALRQRLDHPVLEGGTPAAPLREAIVTHLATEYGWEVVPEAVVMLPGVGVGLNMALRGLLRPGDGVVVHTPARAPVLHAPAAWGLRRIDCPLRPDNETGWRVEREATEAALARSRALLLCNPHNPLGKAFSRDELWDIAGGCLRYGVPIISDELHGGLPLGGRRHVPIASLSPEVARRTVTLMSAGKTWNIDGLQTAFAVVPDAGLRARFETAHDGMAGGVNVLGLEATLAAYRDGGAWRQALLRYLDGNLDLLCEAVDRRLPGVALRRPEAGFLAWLDFRDTPFANDPSRLLIEHARVATTDGRAFGPGGQGFARLNFGCRRAVLHEAIDRVAAALEAA